MRRLVPVATPLSLVSIVVGLTGLFTLPGLSAQSRADDSAARVAAPTPEQIAALQVESLDVDTGREFNGTLQYVGPGQLQVSGQALNVAHWRVIGDRPVELFYDASERLVREEFVEDGHRTVLELKNVSK